LGLAQSPPANPPEPRGIGPLTIRTRAGSYPVRLLRYVNDTVWMLKQTQTGSIEVGLPASEILGFESAEPRVFQAAEIAETPEQIAQVRIALTRLFEALRPFRGLPGIPADRAQLLLGKLAERSGGWVEAQSFYEDVARQSYASPFRDEARFRAGICHVRRGDHEKAMEYLGTAGPPDDDPDLVSEVHYARGQALAALGRCEAALKSYLYLVVFFPYVRTNEARALAAALPCYAELRDWDAAWKTCAVLLDQYAGSPEAAAAEQFRKRHEDALGAERAFSVPAE
jgi:tetratricopeptide (TPR) repeat protein